ncbi:MAG: serine/threonine-protein kinase [Leifsonia sp.]
MPAPFDPALGASYRLIKRIGTGASGEVWLATDSRTSEEVAAKLLRPEHAADHEIVARFVAERSVLTSLRHPDIVAVRDLVIEGDRMAIIMDYVPGGTLREVLDLEHTLTPEQAARATALVLDALSAAHEKGVLHRDVKPDNILLTEKWRALESGDLKLTDFGIARMVETQTRMTSGLIGTPEYMSPEFIATGECGPPADVYAAGVMLYELVSGRTPFAGPGTSFTIAQRHVTADPPPIPVPAELWQLLQTLLDKNPDARPKAAVAAAALRRIGAKLGGVPALAASDAPDRFGTDGRSATVLRGAPLPDTRTTSGVVGGATEPAPDLGESSHDTIHRPMARRVAPATRSSGSPGSGPSGGPLARKPWMNPKVLAAAGGALVLLAVASVFLFDRPSTARDSQPTAAAPSTVSATEQDRPTPTGLTVSRKASWDPASKKATVDITYSTQNAALSGPFLEVLPGATASSTACPDLTWKTGTQPRNLPSVTGISAPCSWSVDPGNIPAQGTQTVTATLSLNLTGRDAQLALQQWLNDAGRATSAAVADTTITSTAYPVQRLRSIEVTTPPSVVTQTSLPITLIPVWPSGPDPLNPLLQTSTIGAPSSMLRAVAGGSGAVRFSDGCSGALAISADGLRVTTLTQTPSCVVDAQVGNFTNLASQPFAIVTRGG